MIIEGERCTLCSWAERHIEALSAIANNRNVWINVRDMFPHPYTKADAQWWVNHCMKNPVNTLPLAIEVDGELVGATGLEWGIGERKHSAEIGYWVGEPYWGQGIASDAVAAMCRYGFEERGTVRIFAEVFAPNVASARVLEKNGFKLEGTLTKAILKDGQYMDAYHYGKVREV